MDEKFNVYFQLKRFSTDNEVVSYFDNHSKRMFRKLITSDLNPGIKIKILYIISKSLNNKERYSAIYYLFIEAYLPLKNNFKESEELNELKYELGKGLHHNRKYKHSKDLFNELAISGFDVERIKPWWNQTIYKKTLENLWFKNEIVTLVLNFILILIFLVLKLYFNLGFESIILVLIIFIILSNFITRYILSNYLKEFEAVYKKIVLNKLIKYKIILDIVLCMLFIPFYILDKEMLVILPVVLTLISWVYFIYVDYKLFPMNIIEHNFSFIKRKRREKNIE